MMMVGVKEDWVLLEESSNSKIFANYDDENGTTLAYKVVLHPSCGIHAPQCQHLKNEFNMLSALDHPCIVTVQSLKHLNQYCVMSQELAFNDYRYYLNKNFENLKLVTISKQFQMIAQAIDYIHCRDLVHNDIKLENILYFDCNTIKLADFGHSEFLQSNNNHHKSDIELWSQWEKRNVSNLAPELVELKKSQMVPMQGVDEKKCDVFSFGISLFLACFGQYPYNLEDQRVEDRFYRYIHQRSFEEFWKLIPYTRSVKEANLLRQVKDLLQKLLAYNPQERISIKEALSHEFFQRSP